METGWEGVEGRMNEKKAEEPKSDIQKERIRKRHK